MADYKYTDVGSCATLTTTNQNRVIRRPLAQRTSDLTKLQTDNLITTGTYVGAKLKPMP